MAIQDWPVTQGAAITIDVTLADESGSAVTAYAGTEPLATTVWAGGEAPASFSPATSWVSAASGTIAVAIAPAQTAALPPGTYDGLTRVVVGGVPTDVYAFTLTILPASGGVAGRTLTLLVPVSAAVAAVPSLAKLSAAEQVAIVERATAAINNAARRTLGSATHAKLFDPGRTREIRLGDYPVTDVARIAADLTPIVAVRYTGAAGRAAIRYATAGASGMETFTGVVLTVSGATVATLPFSTYITAQPLAAAIAAVPGWTASVTAGYEAWPTADLLAGIGSRGAKAAPAYLAAMTRDLDYDLDAARGRVVLRESFADAYRYPDKMVGGCLGWPGSGLPTRTTVLAAFTAGYAADSVPADLAEWVLMAAKWMVERNTYNSQYQSVSVGSSSYTLATQSPSPGLPMTILAGLSRYRSSEEIV